MKKILTLLMSLAICVNITKAQVTVKKDVLGYYAMMPAVPASLDDAYQKCTCKMGCNADSVVASVKRSLNTDAKAMGTLTQSQKQDSAKGMALGHQMQNDHVQSMTDDQKLQYVQNSQQLNGGNPDAIAFAQKMKDDPAEKARLQNMTPDQKLAYLQKNGVFNQTTAMQAPSMDSGQGTATMRLQKQMQDSESCQRKTQLTQALNDKMDMTKINTDHAKIDADENAELSKIPSGALGAIAEKPIKKKYMKKHLELAQTEMQDMIKAYQDLSTFEMNVETPFCNSLKGISYGYTGDASQDKDLNSLAMGQNMVLTNVSNLLDHLKSIYEFGANWQARSLDK
jgi:hypothetical protein